MTSLSITSIIADGLEASVDGRGFTANHLRAVRLADAAPALYRLVAKQLEAMNHTPGGDMNYAGREWEREAGALMAELDARFVASVMEG